MLDRCVSINDGHLIKFFIFSWRCTVVYYQKMAACTTACGKWINAKNLVIRIFS